jgi:hypothetical protein
MRVIPLEVPRPHANHGSDPFAGGDLRDPGLSSLPTRTPADLSTEAEAESDEIDPDLHPEDAWTPGSVGRPARTLNGSSSPKSILGICSGASASNSDSRGSTKHPARTLNGAEVLGGRGERAACSSSPPQCGNPVDALAGLPILATRICPARRPTGRFRGSTETVP